MKLGYYQIFWNKKGTNTFEHRYDVEVEELHKVDVIYSWTLINNFIKTYE